ncbi:MAG: thioredoxin fold domain-containing protein [Desulfobacterales bacterium]
MKVRFFAAVVMIGIVAAAATAAGESAPVRWHSFEEGLALGKSEGKIVFVHFWADWCGYCHTMDKETFHHPAVMSLLNEKFVAVKVDSDREQKLATLFRIRGLPDNWFFSKSGDVLGHRPGYIPADTFIKILRGMADGGSGS